MTLYQVANLNIFIEPTSGGYEIKSSYLNKQTQEIEYKFDYHYMSIEALFNFLPRLIMTLQEPKDVQSLEQFMEDRQKAIDLISKLRDKYKILLVEERKKLSKTRKHR